MIGTLTTAMLVCTAACPPAESKEPTAFFEADGSDAWDPPDPNSDVVKRQGLEVTRRAREKNAIRSATEAALRRTLQSALACVVARLGEHEQQVVRDQRRRFDEWARRLESGASMAADGGRGGLVKASEVTRTEVDSDARSVRLHVKAEIYIRDMEEQVREQVQLLDPSARRSVLVWVQGIEERGGRAPLGHAAATTLIGACRAFGIEATGLEFGFHARRPDDILEDYRKNPERVLAAVKSAGADFAIVGNMVLVDAGTIDAAGAAFPALAGQQRVDLSFHLLLVAPSGELLDEIQFTRGSLGATRDRAVSRALSRWDQRPPAEIERMLRLMKTAP